MQFALVNGRRHEAHPGTAGVCPICGSAMVPKCGSRVVHHWAHASRRDCDPWWENETNWHRQWKNYFPKECREVSHTALNGEIHRADIKTPTGIVIEVQHWLMTDEERESREAFYKNLLWILDGSSFTSRFHLGCMLPDPALGGLKTLFGCSILCPHIDIPPNQLSTESLRFGRSLKLLPTIRASPKRTSGR